MALRLLLLMSALSYSLALVRCATSKPDCRCLSNGSYQDPDDALAHVCGANSQSYLDPCWAKCDGIVPAYYGNCTNKVKLGVSCKKCTGIYDPVCGTDGVNYHNPCFSACAGAEIVSYGLCSKQKNPDIKCMCPKKATSSAAVCGADEETYGNECYAKCKGTTVKSKGRCPFPEVSCNCTLDGENVCAAGAGIDNTTVIHDYDNLCFAACAKSKPVHYGYCLGVGRLITNNWMRWASFAQCGEDGKEYANMCQALCQNVKIKGQKPPNSGCGKPSKQH